MLTLNGVNIYFQNLGTILGIFLEGQNKQNIQERFYSFWNHEATSGELDWLTDTCALFWIHSGGKPARQKLYDSLVGAAMAELDDSNDKTEEQAKEIATERMGLMEQVSWYKTQKGFSHIYQTGTSIAAEKEVGDMTDVFCQTLQSGERQPCES